MWPRPLSWLFDGALGAGPTAYELMLGLALALGLWFALAAPSLARLSRPRLFATLLTVQLAGLLGARWLAWLVAGAPPFERAVDLPLVAYAGLAAGLAALTLLAVLQSWPIRRLADALAPPAALGLGLARIGCFLAGCDYGLPAGGTACVRFPSWALIGEPRPASAALLDHAARAWLPPDAINSLPVDAVQLYESLLGLALFAVLIRLGPRDDLRRPLLLAVGYAAGRFALEALRGDADRGLQVLGTPWSTSQVASLLVILAAGAWMAWRKRSRKPLF